MFCYLCIFYFSFYFFAVRVGAIRTEHTFEVSLGDSSD